MFLEEYSNRLEACDAMEEEEFNEADIAAEVAEFLDKKDIGFTGIVLAGVDHKEDDLIILETENAVFHLRVTKEEN